MCSKKINESQLISLVFCTPLIFARQKCKKISCETWAFFLHFGATKQVFEKQIGNKLLTQKLSNFSGFGSSQVAHEY